MRLALALIVLASPVMADDALTRRALAAVEGNREAVSEAVARCASGLPPLPERLGDDRSDAAQACIVSTALRRHGRAYAMNLVREAEALSFRGVSSLSDLEARLGPTLSDERLLDIAAECGLAQAALESPAGRYAMANLSALSACRG